MSGATNQERNERFTVAHYRATEHDMAAVRSAYGDCAHLCDAVAADIAALHTVRGRVTKRGQDLLAAVKSVGDSIWVLRDKLPPAA